MENASLSKENCNPYGFAQLWAKATRSGTPQVSQGKWSCGCPVLRGDRNIHGYARDSLSWFLDETGNWNLSISELSGLATTLKSELGKSRLAGPGMGLPTGKSIQQFKTAEHKFADLPNLPKVPSGKREAVERGPEWYKVWQSIPPLQSKNAHMWALKPKQPLQYGPIVPLAEAIGFWKKHPKACSRHCPGQSIVGQDKPIRGWCRRGDVGVGTPLFYFNDIVELAETLHAATELGDDGYTKEVKQQLASIVYSSHVSWHIRNIFRYVGLEMAEVLGSFVYQNTVDRAAWDAAQPDIEITKVAPYIRCGVGICRCQYRLLKLGGLKHTFANVGSLLVPYQSELDELSQITTASLAGYSEHISKDLSLVVGGLKSATILDSRVNPSLEKATGFLNTRQSAVVSMAKRDTGGIRSTKRALGKNARRGKDKPVLDVKTAVRGQKPRTPPGDKAGGGKPISSKKDGVGRRSTSGGNAARGERVVGDAGSKLPKPSGNKPNGKGKVDLPAVAGKGSLPKLIANTGGGLAKPVPPIPAQVRPPPKLKRWRRFVKDRCADLTEGQAEEIARSLFIKARRSPEDTLCAWKVLDANPPSGVANIRRKQPVPTQRGPGAAKEGYSTAARRGQQAPLQNAKVSTKSKPSASAGTGSSNPFPEVKAEEVRSVPPEEFPPLVPTHQGVHENGTHPSDEARRPKGAKTHTSSSTGIQLSARKLHKAVGTPPLRVENQRVKSHCKGTQSGPAGRADIGVMVEIQRPNGSESGLYRLGRSCFSAPTGSGARVLPALLCSKSTITEAASMPVGEQRFYPHRCPILCPWRSDEWGYEHSIGQLRSRSFTSLTGDPSNGSRCAYDSAVEYHL